MFDIVVIGIVQHFSERVSFTRPCEIIVPRRQSFFLHLLSEEIIEILYHLVILFLGWGLEDLVRLLPVFKCRYNSLVNTQAFGSRQRLSRITSFLQESIRCIQVLSEEIRSVNSLIVEFAATFAVSGHKHVARIKNLCQDFILRFWTDAEILHRIEYFLNGFFRQTRL